MLSDDNIRYYKIFIVLFPIIFYIPKFFEVRSHYEITDVKREIDCGRMLHIASLLKNPIMAKPIKTQLSNEELESVQRLDKSCRKILADEAKEKADEPRVSELMSQDKMTTLVGPGGGNLLRNVTTSTKKELKVHPTELRKNAYYYKIYFVYLNTFFASLLPLTLLLFFNISTASELIKMSRLESRTLAATGAGRSSMNVNCRRESRPSVATTATRIDLESRRASTAVVMAFSTAAQNARRRLSSTTYTHRRRVNGVFRRWFRSQKSAKTVENLDQALTVPRVASRSGSMKELAKSRHPVGFKTQSRRLREGYRKSISVGEKLNLVRVQENPLQGRRCLTTVDLTSPKRDTGSKLIKQENGTWVTETCLMPETRRNPRVSLTIYNERRLEPSERPRCSDFECLNGHSDLKRRSSDSLSRTALPDIVNHLLMLKSDPGHQHNGYLNVPESSPSREPLLTGKCVSTGQLNARIARIRVHEEEEEDSEFYTSDEDSPDEVARKNSHTSAVSGCCPVNPAHIGSETKKELRLARISLCIVWLFIFCHIWKLIPTAYETFILEDSGVGFNTVWPTWLKRIGQISNTLITINSSLNFLIYVLL